MPPSLLPSTSASGDFRANEFGSPAPTQPTPPLAEFSSEPFEHHLSYMNQERNAFQHYQYQAQQHQAHPLGLQTIDSSDLNAYYTQDGTMPYMGADTSDLMSNGAAGAGVPFQYPMSGASLLPYNPSGT
jgi:hypothetical protein